MFFVVLTRAWKHLLAKSYDNFRVGCAKSILVMVCECLACLSSLSCMWQIISFPTSGDFCCLLITFANSLDPDQARQNVGPDLDPNSLTL